MRGYTLGKWMVSAILATLTLHGKAQERPDIVWMRGWHLGAVNFVSFSSDGQYLISASADRTAKIWRVSDENLVRTFVGHSSGVNCAVFSPDGNYAATGDENTLRVWRLSDGRLLHAISGTTYDIDFSHNSAWVARGGYGNYSVWRLDNGTLVRTFGSAPRAYWEIDFSADGQYLAWGDNYGYFGVHRVSDWQQLYSNRHPSADYVTALDISPNAQFLATSGNPAGSSNSTVYLWNVRTGNMIRQLTGVVGFVRCCQFSPDSQHLAAADSSSYSGYAVRIWYVLDGTLQRSLVHSNEVLSVAYSPNGQYLASGTGGRDCTIYLWNPANGALLKTINPRVGGSITSVAFSPDGQYIATGITDNTIRIWRVSDGSLLRTLRGHSNRVNAVAFSPNGQYLASGSDDNTVKVWRVSDWLQIHNLTGHANIVRAVAFSPDSQYLASGSGDTTIRIWRVDTGGIVTTLYGHIDHVTSLAFSPDGTHLASASQDPSIKIWRVSNWSLRTTLADHDDSVTSIAFSPNGQYLASASVDDTIRLWRVSDWSSERTLYGHSNDVDGVAFARDSKHLISISKDGSIRVWRASNGQIVKTYEQETGANLRAIQFSPNGRFFAYGRTEALVLARADFGGPEGDVNGDGCVDDADLLMVLFAFGQSGSAIVEDVNGDGTVDDADLLIVLFGFGSGC